MDTLGSAIRRERKRLGLSLDAAAKRIGLSKSRLRELESGLSLKTRKPTTATADNVARLARGLGLDQNYLAALAGLGYRIEPVRQDETKLLVTFRSLSPEARSVALRLLEALRPPAIAGGQDGVSSSRSVAAEDEAAWPQINEGGATSR